MIYSPSQCLTAWAACLDPRLVLWLFIGLTSFKLTLFRLIVIRKNWPSLFDYRLFLTPRLTLKHFWDLNYRSMSWPENKNIAIQDLIFSLPRAVSSHQRPVELGRMFKKFSLHEKDWLVFVGHHAKRFSKVCLNNEKVWNSLAAKAIVK